MSASVSVPADDPAPCPAALTPLIASRAGVGRRIPGPLVARPLRDARGGNALLWKGPLVMGPLIMALAAPLARAVDLEGPQTIVVTTTALDSRRGETLQGVEAIDRAELLDAYAPSLGEALARLPGVSQTAFGAGASRPIIRGLGEDRIRVLANGLGGIDASTVSPDHALPADGFEADRIEILKGPAALAYGGGAIGGVVNVLDARIPERRPEGRASGDVFWVFSTVDDGAAGGARADLNAGPFVLHGEVSTRAADDYAVPGFLQSRRQQAEEIAEGEAPDLTRDIAPNSFAEATSSAIGASVIRPWGFVGVAWKRYDADYGITGKKEEDAPDEPALFAGPRIALAQDRYEARGEFEGAGAIERVRAAIAYAQYGHTEIEPSGEAGTVFANEGYEARVEATHAPIGRLRGVIGLQLMRSDFSAVGEEAFLPATVSKDFGLFVVERAELSTNAGVEGGLRAERRSYDSESGARRFTLVSAALGGFVRPAPQGFLGFNLARTERAPTDVELFADGPHVATRAYEIGDADLDKEVGVTAEATARWTGDRLTLEAAAYATSFDGFITLAATGGQEDGLPVFEFRQEDATFFGGELSARAVALQAERWSLVVDAALDGVRAEFDRGGDVPRIPPMRITAGVEFRSDWADARLEATHAAAQDRIDAFELPTDGYTLVNARLTAHPFGDDDRIAVTLEARNLTDAEVRRHTLFLKDLLPAPGRDIRLGLRAAF